MRVALHARVSTSDKGQDPETQLLELRRYAREKSNGTPAIEYVEQETGTGKRRRPVFEQMLRDADHGRFSVLAIWALDRLTREGPLKTMLILQQLASAGVKVKSLREPWLDPESPTYDLLVPIFGWIAQQEAKRISERVQAGLARAREKGVRLGRPRANLNVAQVAALRAEGLSWEAIGSQLGVDEHTAKRAMERERQKPVSSDAS